MAGYKGYGTGARPEVCEEGDGESGYGSGLQLSRGHMVWI